MTKMGCTRMQKPNIDVRGVPACTHKRLTINTQHSYGYTAIYYHMYFRFFTACNYCMLTTTCTLVKFPSKLWISSWGFWAYT